MNTEQVQTPEPEVEAPNTVRSAVEAAYDKHAAEIVEKAPIEQVAEEKTAAQRARDEAGRFARQEQKAQAAPAAPASITDPDASTKAAPAPSTAIGEPPAGWSAEGKAAWSELAKALPGLPPQAQAAVAAIQMAAIRREEAASNGSRQWSEEKRRYDQALAPVREAVKGRGISEGEAIQRMITVQSMLDTRPDEAIRVIASAYGVDLAQIGNPDYRAQPVVRQRPQPQAQAQPQDIQTMVRNAIEQERITAAIDDFSAKNPHFQAVSNLMGFLLDNGKAETLDQAYMMSLKALDLAPPPAPAPQPAVDKRVQEQQRVDKARSVAVSLKGAPSGPAATPTKKFGSVRAAAEAAYDKHAA